MWAGRPPQSDCGGGVLHRWVQGEIDSQTQSRGEQMDRSSTFPKAMQDVFCNASMMQNKVYMARGIYEDPNGRDQNHTFCVIGHQRGREFYFSVIECVAAILIFHDKTLEECQHTQKEFAKNYGAKTQLHVMNKKMASERYKHILWVGPNMVFECIGPTQTHAAYLSFGAGS